MISSPGFTTADYYTGFWTTGTAFTHTVANRTSYTLFYVPETLTFDRIATRTGGTFSGTAVVRLGIYNNSNYKPSSLVLDAGTVSCTAASTLYEITINETLNEGWYWFAWNPQTVATTNSFGSIASTSFGVGLTPQTNTGQSFQAYNETGITGALPANTGTLGTMSNPANVYLRVA